MKYQIPMLSIVCLISGLCSPLANAVEYGDLSGQFIFDGTPPTPKAAVVNKDVAVCGKNKLVDESLVVSKDGGIKNVFVFMYLGRGAKAPAAHPDYAASANAKIVLDNNGCRFEPHAVAIRTTQELVLANSDPVGHNSKIDFFVNPSQNPSLPAGAKLSLKGQTGSAERLPCPVSCSIHPWMTGWVLVQDHPYFAISGDDGKFVIKNIPAGDYTFRVWQEKVGYVQKVNVGGSDESWRGGRFEISIKSGANDLGAIKVPAAEFDK